ncbi:MAG TPA: ABC transporter substrate-binding protein [Casimicrobiaceae bacterium]|nr:ABC transporter substrate-binding protein [Casimicrobiaceae bacterium]
MAALLFAVSGANAQPDPKKVLRVSFPIAETGFDPQAAGDAYSNYVNRAIFDPLYKYDYLARPYKLVPNTAAALPDISPDGLTWTIHVKPGIYFADDPVFKGKRRELTAYDYVYSIKRILDPRMRSNALNVVQGRFVGGDDAIAKAKETGKFDYETPIEGLQALDRFTVRFKLNFPDYELLANLTTSFLAAVAREAIDAYGDASGWAMANPVGTGPYKLKDWRRGQRIVLEPNPGFRDERYPKATNPADHALTAKLEGRKLPLIGQIEISIIEESNPRLLAFQKGSLDFVAVPVDLVPKVLEPDNKLKPEFAQKGIKLYRDVQPAISYLYFNMEDPVIGGYAPEKIALRRAISMAYNIDDDIRVLRQGQGAVATQIIPPGMSGYDATLDVRTKYDIAGARALLEKFGYKDRDGDGFREAPDGKPLTISMASPPSTQDRQGDELWQRSMNAIGVRVEFLKQKWPDLLKMARLGQLQAWRLGNINTTPEGFGMHGLLYSKNAGFSNLARFDLPEYDRAYEKARSLPDSPERTRELRRMSELVSAYAPWVMLAFRVENVLVQPWVLGYKYNPTNQYPFPYLDLDITRRDSAK